MNIYTSPGRQTATLHRRVPLLLAMCLPALSACGADDTLHRRVPLLLAMCLPR